MVKKEKESSSNSRKYVIIGGIFTLSFLGIAAACCYFGTSASDESISAQTFALLRNARLSLIPRRFRTTEATPNVTLPEEAIDIDQALPEPPKAVLADELPDVPSNDLHVE